MRVGKFFVAFIVLFFLIPEISFAQTNCCSANGGPYACDYSTSTLYCKDGTVSRECSCKQATPTPTPSPIPSPIPTLPACVPYSSYDSSLKACKCNSGYIVKENACVSFTQFCWSTFGGNSTYDSGKNSCVCSAGYSWNNEGKNCVSLDQICKDKLGDKSYYNSSDNTCNCFNGFYMQNGKCSLLPSPLPPKSEIVTEVKISAAPLPTPTLTEDENITNVPTKEASEDSPALIVKDGGNTPFVSEAKQEKNVISRIISNILNFLTSIF